MTMGFGKVLLTLLCLIQLVLCANNCYRNSSCNITSTTVTCSGCAPRSVSTEIKDVFIYNLDFSKEINPFSLNGSHIEKLTIIPEKDFDDNEILNINRYTLRWKHSNFLQT